MGRSGAAFVWDLGALRSRIIIASSLFQIDSAEPTN